MENNFEAICSMVWDTVKATRNVAMVSVLVRPEDNPKTLSFVIGANAPNSEGIELLLAHVLKVMRHKKPGNIEYINGAKAS